MIGSKREGYLIKFISYFVLVVVAFICVLPFVMIVTASLSSESELSKHGYSFVVRGFTLEAYKIILTNPKRLLQAYGVTIFVTVVGTIISTLMTAMAAYPLSRKDFVGRKFVNVYFYFTMLFSGGMIPSYILITQYLNMKNNLAVLIVPLLINVWNMFMLRTYFLAVSTSLIEAAKIDGASEIKTFFSIIVPVSKVGIVTIGLLIAMRYWNEWYLSYMYMTKGDYTTLQYYLQSTMSNVEATLQQARSGTGSAVDVSNLPSETARMAICVLASGPMVFLFMFCQKYFEKGITAGSVKG